MVITQHPHYLPIFCCVSKVKWGCTEPRVKENSPGADAWHRCHPSRRISSRSALALWVTSYNVTFFWATESFSRFSAPCAFAGPGAGRSALSRLSSVRQWEGLAPPSRSRVSRGQQLRCQRHSLSPPPPPRPPRLAVSLRQPLSFATRGQNTHGSNTRTCNFWALPRYVAARALDVDVSTGGLCTKRPPTVTESTPEPPPGMLSVCKRGHGSTRECVHTVRARCQISPRHL